MGNNGLDYIIEALAKRPSTLRGEMLKNKFKKFDDIFIELINKRMGNKYLDYIMYRVTNLGSAPFAAFVIFTMMFFGNNRFKNIGVELFLALSISQVIVHSLKILLSRERPYNILEQLNTFGIDLKDYSFPSGHTAASFSLATTIALNIPKISIIVYFLAIIVAISRIYLGVHYPTDVAAGIIIGLFFSIMVHVYLLEFVYNLGERIGIN